MARRDKPLKPRLLPLSLKEKEFLIKSYLKDELSAPELAERLKVSPRLIYSRLKAHGISKEHPITGIKHKYRSAKYCPHCGQVLPSQR